MKTEAETRKELIDVKLHAAGWDVNNLTQVSKEFLIFLCLCQMEGQKRGRLMKAINLVIMFYWVKTGSRSLLKLKRVLKTLQ